jgi:hypothetical protein
MGYNGASSLKIPLYYIYADAVVYHVSNNDANPVGNNNIGCGYLAFPCESIDQAISRNLLSANPANIGIISGYKLNTS